MRHDTKVVTDEQHREAAPTLQVAQQVHDLRAGRHVERGNGLVSDDEGRISANRARDHRPLALPAGNFVRIAVRKGVGQSGLRQNLEGADARLRAGPALNAQVLDDRVAERHARVERARRVLEHDLALSAEAHELGTGSARDGLTLEAHVSSARRLQANEHSSERALSASALADEPERAAADDCEVDPVDRAQDAFSRQLEMPSEVHRFHEGVAQEALQQAT
jgi:hypothetical protein